MPTVPYPREDRARIAGAKSAVAARYASTSPDPMQPQPSELQKGAATKTNRLYQANKDDSRYRESLLGNGTRDTSKPVTWSTQKLDQALELAYWVDLANGVDFARNADKQKQAWLEANKHKVQVQP